MFVGDWGDGWVWNRGCFFCGGGIGGGLMVIGEFGEDDVMVDVG